jgi:membrane protease YdiL (CAAX protease family)
MDAALPARLARDPAFAAALAAGPVVWIAAALAFGVQPNPAWVLSDPLRYASLALAWPVLEEWLFRGVIQPAVARTDWGAREAWGVTTANVATSVLFAAAHLLSHPPGWAAAAFLPSLVFGCFRDRYGSFAPSAALHVFYNSGWFLAFAPL